MLFEYFLGDIKEIIEVNVHDGNTKVVKSEKNFAPSYSCKRHLFNVKTIYEVFL